MVSKAKLYSKLDDLELELKERLVPHLQQAAAGNNELAFCVKGYHSFKLLKSESDKTMAELVDIGAQILSLKEKLGEGSDGSIAERICWYCHEWSNTGDQHRKSAPALAKQFLNEII